MALGYGILGVDPVPLMIIGCEFLNWCVLYSLAMCMY